LIQHWLLDLAVESPVWLKQIFPVVDAEGLNVKPVPECGPEDYAAALTELSRSGAIVLSPSSFELTQLGGERWEIVAQPAWDDILTASSDFDSGELCSPNRNLLMAYMGWYEQLEERKISVKTVEWQTHSDFQILYWKRLPLVHDVSFALQPGVRRRLIPQPKWFWEWFVSTASWRKRPWQLPDWPRGSRS
jgi:hypothetical protein